ncbi:MAG: TonB-dependent receptor [Verrucomicrobia bacterium]|nr:MAG: TonB-dependent receptor [Verrucomicrobiota bacterium]
MIRTGLYTFGSLRMTLAACVGIPLIIASSAFAQNPPPPPPPQGAAPPAATAEAERVIVTGSNIPTAEEVGPNPVDTYNRDSINKSGELTTETFLLSLPVVNANVVPISNNENGSNTAVGAATVALHGFDARATLILLDGRRVAPYPTGNNPGLVNVMFVDLNSIPQAAIESIEILKDGASTTYGADAVAGVVNLKMRHRYDGAESRVEYGNTLDKDSGLFDASAVFGVGKGDTNITGVLNYYHRNSIANRDRGFSANPPFLSSNNSPYNLQLSSDVAGAAGGQNLNPGGTEFASAPDLTNGLAPANTYLYLADRRVRAAGGLRPGFNFNQFSLSFPESERYGVWLSADHKVFGDQLVVYADGFYQNVKTHNELAAPATGSFQTLGQTTLAIPPQSPIAPGAEPPNTPTHAETGLPADAFNPFNPFQQIISGGTRARLAEFGNRLFDNETDAWLSTIGFKGDKLFDGTWGYDAAFRYSQLKNTVTGTQVSASRFNRILNQADPIFQPGGALAGQPAFNPFGDFRAPIPSNEATVEFARVHPKDEDTSKLATLDATMYTTALFNLPAGGVGLAFGGQFRRESLKENPDMLNVEGDIVGNSPVPTAQGGRKAYAFYAETSIPIFSPANAIPGFHSLEFVAGGRFEEFLNNDTNVLVPKVGMRWQPFDEQLTLRATWGEGFREPSLEELFGSPLSTLEPSHDPKKGGVFEPETNTLISSNPGLQPEDSRSFSGGFVYTPKYVPGLNLSVDFWDIERTGVVTAPLDDQVLQRELTGTLLPGEAVERDIGGNITRILSRNQNIGNQEARGFDFGLQYQRPTPWGTFTSLTQVTYLDEFIFQGFIFREFGPDNGNLAGRTTDPGTSNEGWYKWKGTSSLDWTWKGFDLYAIARYIDGFHEFTPNLHQHWVHQTVFVDVQASYDFTALLPVEERPVPGYSKGEKEVVRGKDGNPLETASAQTSNYARSVLDHLLRGTILTIGCNDVFGQDPPKAFGEGGNAVGYPGFTYDATGRFVYGRITKKF